MIFYFLFSGIVFGLIYSGFSGLGLCFRGRVGYGFLGF